MPTVRGLCPRLGLSVRYFPVLEMWWEQRGEAEPEMKAVFRYPGSKWTAAAWIVSHFPADYEKAVYLEPYFGSGAVFFTKKPSVVETINDLDDEVVNLFQMLRSQPEELAREIELTPYSRREYDLAFQPCEEPLERARRFLVRTNQAIGAKMGGKCGWRNHKQKKIGGTACKWRESRRQSGWLLCACRAAETSLCRLRRWTHFG